MDDNKYNYVCCAIYLLVVHVKSHNTVVVYITRYHINDHYFNFGTL